MGNTIWGHPDYWITIAPVAFPDSGGALKWCTSQGLDSDHCDAQNIATGHAAYNSVVARAGFEPAILQLMRLTDTNFNFPPPRYIQLSSP